jgi:hypothetical protein
VITVDIGGSPDEIVEAILTALQREHHELRLQSGRGTE